MPKKVHITNTLCEGGATRKTTVYKPKGVWSTEKLTVGSCEVFDAGATTVKLAPTVYVKVQGLLDKYPHLEWLVYLVGKKVADGYLGSDIVIPKQEQSSSTVDLDPADVVDLTNVIGTIHSHHTMGAFFSGTDDSFIVPNHPVAIIVSTSGWACKVRATLPCGHYMAGKATLIMITSVNTDLSELSKLADEKMKVKATVSSVITKYGGVVDGVCETLYKCLLCSELKPYQELSWLGKGWFYKECVELVSEINKPAWVLLAEYCRNHPNEERHIPFLRDIGGTGGVVGKKVETIQQSLPCSRCGLHTPIRELIIANGRNVCKDCLSESNFYD